MVVKVIVSFSLMGGSGAKRKSRREIVSVCESNGESTTEDVERRGNERIGW
jgi:hypothetical protein